MIGYGIWGSEKAAGTRHIHQEISLPQYVPLSDSRKRNFILKSSRRRADGWSPAFSYLPAMMDFFN